MDAQQLKKLLELDFRPADLGDTPEQFTARLGYLIDAAMARADATSAQQEAGVRYLLLGSQLRQLTRQAETLKSASGASISQGLATRIAELRAQQAEQLALSGLAPPTEFASKMPRSTSVGVEVF